MKGLTLEEYKKSGVSGEFCPWDGLYYPDGVPMPPKPEPIPGPIAPPEPPIDPPLIADESETGKKNGKNTKPKIED